MSIQRCSNRTMDAKCSVSLSPRFVKDRHSPLPPLIGADFLPAPPPFPFPQKGALAEPSESP